MVSELLASKAIFEKGMHTRDRAIALMMQTIDDPCHNICVAYHFYTEIKVICALK